ncbi:hypothetical protein SAMN05443575_3931 [Jatrophihabitans endophyticus]|uniref:Uncharacterized protein n=1 Tax=Jatrophihabitans endophyticus TaxID=1206085 RepID=A0A1M5T7R3_9ACTN|nr:hypothetical protein [Jatrophihabitans endophyticus]SHH46779.1 hypothetical protein SAMN05443575_3931 [Jatrophihabitans endophyticus]
MSRRLRGLLLPLLAVVLVAGVLTVEVAHGGGDYAPRRAADPCVTRPATSVSTGLEGLGEQLVLLGVNGAACRLGESREALVLELARPGTRTPAQVAAVRAGLLAAVDRLQAEGRLPRASSLVDEALDMSDLNGFVKALIRAVPDSVVDNALHTDDVLRRTIRKLDLARLLTDVSDVDALNRQLGAAVGAAVKDALIARLRDLL